MTTSSQAAYRALLSHPLWQRKRLQILERDGFKCRKCGCDYKRLEVHHLKYFRKRVKPWEYPDRFLMTLCCDCHAEQSALQKRRKPRLRAAWRRVRA